MRPLYQPATSRSCHAIVSRAGSYLETTMSSRAKKKYIYIYTFFLDRIVAEERSISSKFPFEFSSGTGRIELLIIFTIAIRRLGKDQHVTSVVVTREEKSARAEARARGRRAITFDRAGIARSFDSSVIAVRVEFQRRVVTIE